MLSFIFTTLLFLVQTGLCGDGTEPEPLDYRKEEMKQTQEFQGLSLNNQVFRLLRREQRAKDQPGADFQDRYEGLSTEQILVEIDKQKSKMQKKKDDAQRLIREQMEEDQRRAQAVEQDLRQKVEESDNRVIIISVVGGSVLLATVISIGWCWRRRQMIKKARAAVRAKAPTVGIERHSVVCK